MPPKIQRYATEPKHVEKLAGRTSIKIYSFAKNTVGKFKDFKRYTVPSNKDKQVFMDGQILGQSFNPYDYKKKSFIVSKRKTNKSILDQKFQKIHLNKQTNKWIQKIQHQSYQGLREYNQDRILVKEDFNINQEQVSIFAVFDGHGGASASQYLQLHFSKTFQTFAKQHKISDALTKSIEELEKKILKAGMKIISGSCATILIIKQNNYWVANVGDSRVIFIKDLQQCKQITEDHKPQNPSEFKRIQSLGGKIYRNVIVDEATKQKNYGPFRVLPSRLSVTRAIGDYMIKKNQLQSVISAVPDIYQGKLEYQDVILLISDGAYQQFSNNQLSIIFSNKTKQPLKQRMVNFLTSAAKKHTNDNASVIAIQIKDKQQNMQKSINQTQPPLSNLQIKL